MGYILPITPDQFIQYARRAEKKESFHPVQETYPSFRAVLRDQNQEDAPPKKQPFVKKRKFVAHETLPPMTPIVTAPEITGKGLMLDTQI